MKFYNALTKSEITENDSKRKILGRLDAALTRLLPTLIDVLIVKVNSSFKLLLQFLESETLKFSLVEVFLDPEKNATKVRLEKKENDRRVLIVHGLKKSKFGN